MNSFSCIARLTSDPKELASGKVVVFGIANNTSEKKNGEIVKHTLFINCSVFGNMKDYCMKHLYKGLSIFISGELMPDNYVDREGNNKEYFKMLVSKISRLDNKNQPNKYDNEPVKLSIDLDDDMPDFVETNPF